MRSGRRSAYKAGAAATVATRSRVNGIARGLVHAAFGDESDDDDGGYWLHTKCDVCGQPE